MNPFYDDLLGSIFGGLPRPRYSDTPVVRRPAPPSPPPARNLEEEIAARKARIAEEQRALEEAEKAYAEERKKIRYNADDTKIEMLVPRDKMIKMIQGLTEAIKNNPDANTYKVTINL